MKEDILEQIVEDYLHVEGYFTISNVKFRPNSADPESETKDDSNHSDIDVLGFNPNRKGHDRIWAVSCKSWQSGFAPEKRIKAILDGKIISGREDWRGFRELVRPKWGLALTNEIAKLTGSRIFTHVTAVTKLNGNASTWEKYEAFSRNIEGNTLKILQLSSMLDEISLKMTTKLEQSEVGRLLQGLKPRDGQDEIKLRRSFAFSQ